jgi:UDP-glucose 4-epimerase
MKILITGGSGFIGSNIANYLNKKFDIVITYRKILPKIKNSKIKIIKSNLSNTLKLPKKCDAIIHCAADSPEHSPDKKLMKINNINCTNKLLEYATKKNVKIFFFMSSMSVYGKINSKKVSELTKTNNKDFYGYSKYICEKNIIKWSAINSKPSIIFRLPGIVGHNSKRNFLSETLIKIMNDKKITVKNPNSLFNNVVYVETISDFIENMLTQNKKISTQIFTLGSKNPIKIKNVIRFIYKLLNKEEKIEWLKNDNNSFLINYNKIKSFGFKDMSVKDCLKKFVIDNIK